MIAHIAKTLLLAQCSLAILFYVLLTKLVATNTLIAITFSITLIILLRASITANCFMLTWPHRNSSSSTPILNWPQIIRLFTGELCATLLCSSWGMPFRRFHKHIAANTTALPVLLVHGYGCNSGYWHWMSQALKKARITHYAIDMEPVFGSIDSYTPRLHATIQRLLSENTQKKIIIVAHSMGGLAIRAYLRDYGCDHIAKIITLGTPHHGTTIANFGIGINCREMNWLGDAKENVSNPWLHQLTATENATHRALIVSLYSHHDNIIFPQISSHLPNAENIPVNGIGHVALALHPTIQTRVIAEIHRASLSSGRPNAAD